MLVDYSGVNISQDDHEILSKVNFHVDDGEFVYVIGKVGSGKSSLLKTIYQELDITEAEKAEVLQKDLMRIKRREVPALRKQMGIIFQDFQLLHDRSVAKNLMFVLRSTGWKDKKKAEERIEEVLEEVQMADKKDKMPHELSGGEQQRIAISRAILNSPKMIIADEPTANLDPDTASSIVGLLKDICKTGTAVVMSTHNIQMIDKYSGVVYCCMDGTLKDVSKEYSTIMIDD